jgi:hypothetical protein
MGLSLRGTTSGAVDINAPAVAGDNTITLPGNNGAANQFYKNSGTAGIVTYSSMVEDSSGRIGIGTTGSSYPLSINEGSSGNKFLMLQKNSGQELFQIKEDGDNHIILDASHASGELIFNTAGTEKIRIDSSGRLLVGPTSSSQVNTAVFQGNSAAGSAAGVIISSTLNNPSSTQVLGKVAFADNGHGDAASVRGRRDGGTWTSGSSQPTALTFSTTADGASSPTEQMRIDSSGNFGIATTTPSSFGKFAIRSHAGTIDAVPNVSAHIADGSNSALYIGHSSGLVQLVANSAISFGYTNGTTNSERMRIDSSGNVAINYTLPLSSKLTLTIGNVSNRGKWSDCEIALDNPTNVGAYSQIGMGYVFNSTYASAYMGFVSTSQATFGYGDIVFGTRAVSSDTQPTERMRIDSSGQIQMGRTSVVGDERLALQSTTGKCAYVFQGANANRNCMELRNTYAQGGQTAQMIRFVQQNGGQVGQITSTATATSYLSGASDSRLKKNIEDWNEDILQYFKTLNPRKFNYLTQEDGDPKTKGYIAQDLAAAFPEAYPSLYDEDSGDDRYSYNPGGMVVYLMKALQEAIAKIETLETQNADLLSRVTALEG